MGRRTLHQLRGAAGHGWTTTTEFVERWPGLQDWFDAPLRQRLLDRQNCVRGQHPHGGASVIMPYLTYLSLVEGVGLDYRCCSAAPSPARSNSRSATVGWVSTSSCSTGTWHG